VAIFSCAVGWVEHASIGTLVPPLWCNTPPVRIAVVGLALLVTGCRMGSAGSALDRLHPCAIAEGPPDAFCGQLPVFENRTEQRGRMINLKIVVAPALRRDAKADPLFIFEGGPGGGAATLARYRVPMFRRFQTDRDIVLVDQRGTGGSNPLDCATDEPEEEDFRSIDDYPIDRFRTCLDKLHADPRFYTTSVAMDDIDDVRAYLGYRSINLWGGSYGTRAALVYLKQHEAAVRSVVLDGVAPTDMRLPLFMARDSQRALDRLLDDCARDAACAREFPNLRQTVVALWARLAERPTVPFTHPRTGQQKTVAVSQRLIASVVFQALYSPEISALLPRLLTDAAAGRYQGLFALAFSREMPKGSMSDGMFLSVVCAEDLPRVTAADIARESTGRFMGATMFETQLKPCAFWPRGTVTDDYYAAVTSSRPTVIFSGANDPVTPPSWGEHVAERLSRSRHFVVPGAGHITLTRGCVSELVAAFLDAGSADRLDGGCLASLTRPPFFTNYTEPGRP
jgi:pimeloyl-ACP methyl ester carboxylesterase